MMTALKYFTFEQSFSESTLTKCVFNLIPVTQTTASHGNKCM